jgi:hypothetical protein
VRGRTSERPLMVCRIREDIGTLADTTRGVFLVCESNRGDSARHLGWVRCVSCCSA